MKKRLMIIAAVTLVLCTTIAIAQQPNVQPLQSNQGAEIMKKLKLTDDQRKEIEKLRVDQMKQGITQRSKRETAALELQQLLKADTPEKAAIEKKVNEISQLDAQGKVARLNHWFGVNKVLTPDQQKVWKRMLGRELAVKKAQAQVQRLRRIAAGLRMQGRQQMRPGMQQRMMGRQMMMRGRGQMMQERGQMMKQRGGQMLRQGYPLENKEVPREEVKIKK